MILEQNEMLLELMELNFGIEMEWNDMNEVKWSKYKNNFEMDWSDEN